MSTTDDLLLRCSARWEAKKQNRSTSVRLTHPIKWIKDPTTRAPCTLDDAGHTPLHRFSADEMGKREHHQQVKEISKNRVHALMISETPRRGRRRPGARKTLLQKAEALAAFLRLTRMLNDKEGRWGKAIFIGNRPCFGLRKGENTSGHGKKPSPL